LVSATEIPHNCGAVLSYRKIGANDFEMVCAFCHRIMGNWKYTPIKRKKLYPKKRDYSEVEKEGLV